MIQQITEKTNIQGQCQWVLENASKGTTNCRFDIDLNLIPLQIALSLILLFIAWRAWLWYKNNLQDKVNKSQEQEVESEENDS